jgi:hypothetical protein
MKKNFLVIFIFVLTNFIQAEIEPVKFILFRMDYQSYEVKNQYYFTQPYDVVLPDSEETVYHDMYVRIFPAGDFGETIIRCRTSGQMIYKASTVWMGTGEHIFPLTATKTSLSTEAGNAAPKFIHFEEYFFETNDAARADTAWHLAQDFAPLSLFGNKEYGVLAYLHYFSVGMSDPTTAEWIVLFYSIADEIPEGNWKNIGNNFVDPNINDAKVHFAYEENIFAATKKGLFQTFDSGHAWSLVEFSDEANVNVTVVEATPNPWVDCLCEYLYLGTEEYTTIPEERKGRIFRSQIDGTNWEDTKFPGDAVTAIGINRYNPHTVYAASFNPFYNRWGLYKLKRKDDWKILMPQPWDSRVFRFNCITVCPTDSNLIFVGSDQGVMISRDGGTNWEQHLHLNISSIQFFEDKVFVATNNKPESRSDGIWMSEDKGKSWEVYKYWLHCVEMVTTNRFERNKPAYFFLGDSSQGVFVTREASLSWQDITKGLPNNRVTCLAKNLSNPPFIVVGTENGLFRYEQISTAIEIPFNEKSALPESAKLIFNYPNPFNASTKFCYTVMENVAVVKVVIYNSLGQLVKVLVNENKSAGEYLIEWDGRNDSSGILSSGIYFCKIELNGSIGDWTKLILLR